MFDGLFHFRLMYPFLCEEALKTYVCDAMQPCIQCSNALLIPNSHSSVSGEHAAISNLYASHNLCPEN